MTITIGNFSSSKLIAQPFGYDEVDTEAGLTARMWRISGLLTASEWQALLSEYNSWRDTRITDEDTVSSASVGTTVELTTSANGITWTTIDCWFTTAPSGEQAGAYVQATVELVDAAQKLAVLLRQDEKSRERSQSATPNLGTVTLGSATLTLLTPMETYQDVPQLQLTATGSHVVSGPLAATRVRRIQGTTDSTGWGNVRSWFETSVASLPSTNDWYPISAPTATARVIINSGAKETEYTVTVDVAEVK